MISIVLAIFRGSLPQIRPSPPEREYRMLLVEVLHKHFSHLLERSWTRGRGHRRGRSIPTTLPP